MRDFVRAHNSFEVRYFYSKHSNMICVTRCTNMFQCRIYPVIFIPALVLHILKPGKRADPVYPHDMETVNNRVVCGYLTKPSPNEWVRKRTLLLVPLYFRNLLIIDSHLCSIEYSYESIKDSTRFVCLFVGSCLLFLLSRQS